MTKTSDLVAILDLQRIEDNVFLGPTASSGWARVFGGQLIGQGLAAAYQTVDNRPAHSLHANFLVIGDPASPILYMVERVRDGGSFSNRRITAVQHGRTIFTMSASFHRAEHGFDHQIPAPHAIDPAHLPPDESIFRQQLLEKMPDSVRVYFERERPIELRPGSVERYTEQHVRLLENEVWMRPRGAVPEDLEFSHCALAYASDFTLLDTSLAPHNRTVFGADVQAASLDHSVWFHRPFRFDDWVLYAQDTPSAYDGLGFSRGRLYSRDGVLIASTAQEGLIRPVLSAQ